MGIDDILFGEGGQQARLYFSHNQSPQRRYEIIIVPCDFCAYQYASL